MSGTDERRADRFKDAFRRYPTGIALVTATGPDGPVGLTASSLASVAAEPPVVSFSVATTGRSAAVLLGSGDVAIHVLPAARADLADAFARADGPRFVPAQGWTAGPGGGLVLPDALATLHCAVRTLVPVGPSTLVLADVRGVDLGPDAEPLVHVDRTFRGLGRRLGTDAEWRETA